MPTQKAIDARTPGQLSKARESAGAGPIPARLPPRSPCGLHRRRVNRVGENDGAVPHSRGCVMNDILPDGRAFEAYRDEIQAYRQRQGLKPVSQTDIRLLFEQAARQIRCVPPPMSETR